MRALVSMIIMTILWHRKKVTIYQRGKIVAIGKVVHISDHWLNITNVMMADNSNSGDIIMRPRLAVSRSRVDLFWTYREGEEFQLQQLGNGDHKADHDDDTREE